jgi:hypothetical protein
MGNVSVVWLLIFAPTACASRVGVGAPAVVIAHADGVEFFLRGSDNRIHPVTRVAFAREMIRPPIVVPESLVESVVEEGAVAEHQAAPRDLHQAVHLYDAFFSKAFVLALGCIILALVVTIAMVVFSPH